MNKVNFLDNQFFFKLKEGLIKNNALSEKEFEIFETIEIMSKLTGEKLDQDEAQKTIKELMEES